MLDRRPSDVPMHCVRYSGISVRVKHPVYDPQSIVPELLPMEVMALLQRSLLVGRPPGQPSAAVASTSGRCAADSTAAAAFSYGSRRRQRCQHAFTGFRARLVPQMHAQRPSPNHLRHPRCPRLGDLLLSASHGVLSCCRRCDRDVLTLDRRLSHTSLAAQSPSATISPAEREVAEEVVSADEGDCPEQSAEALEAAAQTLAELLPGSVPTPRLQPQEVRPGNSGCPSVRVPSAQQK